MAAVRPVGVVTDEMQRCCQGLVLGINVPWSYRVAVQGKGMCLGLTVAEGELVVSRWNEPAWELVICVNEWALGARVEETRGTERLHLVVGSGQPEYTVEKAYRCEQ